MSSQKNSNLKNNEKTNIGENIIYGDIIDEDVIEEDIIVEDVINENIIEENMDSEDDQQGVDLVQIYNLLNNMDLNEISSMFEDMMGDIGGSGLDFINSANRTSNNKGISILNALKPLLPNEKVKLMDTIIQVYTIRSILRK